jgi:hypothetical protein
LGGDEGGSRLSYPDSSDNKLDGVKKMSKKKSILDNGKRQRISDRVLILTLFVQILLLVNQSIGIYTVAAQSIHASIIEPTGEKLEVHIETDTGRLNPVEKLIKGARDWVGSYYVGGVEKTQATTGITISVTGSNVASTAYVDYYIEAVPQSGGTPYKFLEGNNTAITVGGSAHNPSNQTTITNHLTAMGLSTTASHTVDYYVYVKAAATGAVSGETLTSEILYTKFDTVTYGYGTEITEDLTPTLDGGVYIGPSNEGGGIWGANDDFVGMYWNMKERLLTQYDIPEGVYTNAELHLYEYSWDGTGGSITWDLYSCTPFHMVTTYAANFTTWATQPASLDQVSTLTVTNKAEWRTWSGQGLTDYIDSKAGGAAYLKLMIPNEDFEVQFKNGGFEDTKSARVNDPHMEVTYLGFDASWYPLPPLSLAELPITLDVVAMAALIMATAYTLQSRRRNS